MSSIKRWITLNYPVISVVIVPLLLFIVPLITRKVFFWGTPTLQFIPWQTYAFESVRKGILPLWNPLNGMGAPLLANYQLAFFYPTNWLVFLLFLVGGTAWLAWGQTAMIVFHLIWAGAGIVFLTRRLGFDKPAQAVAGLCFCLSGYLVTRTSFFPMIWAASWIPWILFSGSKFANPIRREPENGGLKIKDAALLTIFIVLQLLSGHAQLSWYTIILLVLWVFVGSLKSGKFRKVLTNLGIVFGCILIAGLICAVQLIPTFEYLVQSQRASSVATGIALNYSFWPGHFLTLLSPNIFGTPVLGTVWGSGSFWEDAIYFGVMPLLLTISTLGILFRKSKEPSNRKRLTIFCWIMIAVSFLCGLGKNSFLFMFLFRYIPTFDLFQAPARFLVWFTFCAAILAGVAVDQRKAPVGKTLYFLRLATMGGAAIALAGGLGYWLLPGLKPTMFLGLVWFGLLAAGGGLLWLFQLQRKPTAWIILLLLLISFDLVIGWWNIAPTISATYFKEEITTGVIPNGRIFIGQNDELALKYGRFFRFKDFRADESWSGIYQTIIPNTNLLLGVASANNFDPLVPEHFQTWMNNLEEVPAEQMPDWLALMGVGTWEKVDDQAIAGVAWEKIENTARVRFYNCGVNAKSESESLEMVRDLIQERSPELPNLVVVENSGDQIGSSECQDLTSSAISSYEDNGDRVIIHVTTEGEGFVFLADTWFPGWKVTIDGKQGEILRADHLFKAVKVSAGTHIVIFYYQPGSFLAGVLVTTTTISVAILGTVLFTILRRRYHGEH